MSQETINFVNILAEKKLRNDDAFFMSHPYKPVIAYKQTKYFSPDELKVTVLHSSEISKVIEQVRTYKIKKRILYL